VPPPTCLRCIGSISGSRSPTTADLAIHLRGLESFDALDPVERVRFAAELGRLFVLGEHVYFFYLEGAIAPEQWKVLQKTTADLLAYPGAQTWWATRKHWHAAGFQELVDRIIEEGRKPTLYERYTKHLQR
jgi:hypothetical protein